MDPAPRYINSGVFKKINGVWHKRCNGPAHDEPVYLPATEKYFYKRKKSKPGHGTYMSTCRLCNNWKYTVEHHGRMEISSVIRFYHEAVNRVGVTELSRRTGISVKGLLHVVMGRATYVRKDNFRKVLLELISMRRHNEYSINNHSSWRNVRRINGYQTCAGCGGNLWNYTKGCKACETRKSIRLTREKSSATLVI